MPSSGISPGVTFRVLQNSSENSSNSSFGYVSGAHSGIYSRVPSRFLPEVPSGFPLQMDYKFDSCIPSEIFRNVQEFIVGFFQNFFFEFLL